MNNGFNYEVNKILKMAEQEMLELKHPYVGTEHLLLSLLKVERIANICKKYKLTYNLFYQELKTIIGVSSKKSEVILYTPLLRLVLEQALILAKNENIELNEIHLMNALLTSDDGIALRLLMGLNIDIDSLYNEIATLKFNALGNIGTNLNDKCTNILIGRDKEINNIIEILLRKNKNNPLLIGGAGVGKSAIVYELARRINASLVPEKLKSAKIISIDMASMLSNTKYRGEFETRINNIINEVKKNKNIILFIDEIHTIVKSGGGEGSIDAANILKPYLASDEIKVIGATTIVEYEKYIAKDKALSRRFANVMINEPKVDEVISILNGVKPLYENHHHLKISDEAIKTIVEMSNKYIFNNHNPDKSLDVLDCVCSRVSLKNNQANYEMQCTEFLQNKDYKNALKVKKLARKKNNLLITKEDIESVIEDLTNIKILKKDDYLKLIKYLDTNIIGQNLDDLKNVLKKRFINDKVFSLLIRGEKGVGKSYTAKVIADSLGYNFIEMDMSLFQSSTSINKIMGSDPGYVGYDDETILDKVKYHPYSLILLKNIELASSNVKNLFFNIIKNGTVKDNKGDIVNFNNTMVIMTSSIVDNSLGYNKKSKNSYGIDTIDYELIDKKYLCSYEEYKSILSKLNDKTTFTEINKLKEEAIYNMEVSML